MGRSQYWISADTERWFNPTPKEKTLSRRTILRELSCVLVAAATFAVLPVMAEEKKPNVVFILADNVGYGDLSPYGGGELRGAATPRIDQEK